MIPSSPPDLPRHVEEAPVDSALGSQQEEELEVEARLEREEKEEQATQAAAARFEAEREEAEAAGARVGEDIPTHLDQCRRVQFRGSMSDSEEQVTQHPMNVGAVEILGFPSVLRAEQWGKQWAAQPFPNCADDGSDRNRYAARG